MHHTSYYFTLLFSLFTVRACTTRGNVFTLDKGLAKYDLRKYYFTNRVVNVSVNARNSLPDHVVLSETINTFKSRLDKFWQHQDMIYDFRAELHGTGSHTVYSTVRNLSIYSELTLLLDAGI